MAEIILQDIRIGTDVHMLVTLTDSGVAISWDSVDIQQLFAYSEPQRAFAGNCTYVIDEEDATKLHVTYPAAVQKLLGKMRLVAQVNLIGNVATYDAFAFNIVKFSDDDEDLTVEEIEIPLAVEAVDTTIMYEILRACQAATAAANEAKEGADEAADAATAAAAAANSAADAANSAAEAATAAKEAADLATAAANAAADSANSAAADATAGAAAANAAAAAAAAAKEAADRATTAANSAAAAATSAANSANAAASAATTATTNATAATAAANSAATAASSAAAAATAAKEAADLATAAATAAAAAANAAAARVETAIENAAAATTAANSAAADATAGAAAANSAAAAATAAKEAADLATTAANTAAATANTAAEAANSAAAAAEAAAAQIPALVANKANIDGWYSAMTVGAAENLVGRGTTPAVISFRPAGGTQDIGTGAASIAKIKGRTDGWNQGVRNAQFDAVGNWNSTNATFSVSGDKGTFTANAQNGGIYQNNVLPKEAGRKVFVAVTLKTTAAVNEIDVYMYGGYAILRNASSGYQTISGYITTNASWGVDLNNNHIQIRDRRTAGWDAVVVASVVAIDLTLEYTAGREPATAAAFLSEYPEALIAPYNAGKLIPNKVTALVTDGYNQWDEQYEVGKAISPETGAAVTNNTTSVAKNFIPVFPNTEYYYQNGTWANRRIAYYDIAQNFISLFQTPGNGKFTTPANCYFVKFYWLGTTYNHDIAINLSHSGIRDGEYEPYWTSTLNIDHSKIYGKLNGAGEMVQIAPNGFRGVGTNCDEVDVVRKEAYIRRAWVDMGTLNYGYNSGSTYPYFSAQVPGMAILANGNANTIISGKLASISAVTNISWFSTHDYNKMMCMIGGEDRIMLQDTAYSDAAAFKTAMSGVMLDYQLATPLHYTDLMYSEDGGQTFVEIPAGYRVDDYGTERRLPDGLVDGAPASTPLVAEIAYAMNAVDPLRNLPRNYLSKQSTVNLLAAMQSAGIIAGYTMTYDEDNAEYDFIITAPTGA